MTLKNIPRQCTEANEILTNKTENVTWKLLALSQKNKSKPQAVTPETIFEEVASQGAHLEYRLLRLAPTEI